MEIRNLVTFIKVCEFMSFSKAADFLGYAQSSVTSQIQQLEKELGVKLFERVGKHFTISAKGSELLSYANSITALAAQAYHTVSNTNVPCGKLRIGVIESICSFVLPKILEIYLRRFPQVDIAVKTATTLEIMEMLRKNQVDLIVTLDERVSDPDWHTALEREENIIFLCSPQHPFAGRGDVCLGDVVRENLILTEKGCNYRQTFEHICNTRNLHIQSSLEIGNTNNILEFTARNLGITFLPEVTAQKALSRKELASFQIRDCSMQMLIQLIYRKSKWFSPAMEAFISLANEKIVTNLF